MLGPTAAMTSAAFVPYRARNASTATITAPAAVPLQPAWTAATAPLRRSARRIGTQSATLTLMAIDGSSVTAISASGRLSRFASCASNTSAQCTWCMRTSEAGSTSSARASDAQPWRRSSEHTLEREFARAEAMTRDACERAAPQRGAPRLLRPLKLAARLWVGT